MLIGWLAARLGGFDEAATRGLSLFAFNFAIPVMLVRTLSRVELPAQPEWNLLLVYFAGAFVVFGAGAGLAAKSFRRGGAAPAIFGISAAFSNTLILGIPLVLKAYGEPAALPLSLLIAFHSAVLFMLTTLVAESGLGARGTLAGVALGVGQGLVANPILWGIGVGLALNLLGIRLPYVLDELASTLGAAALPSALFALGANLNRFGLAQSLAPAAMLTGLKILVHPVLVYLLGRHVLALAPISLTVAVTLAALPTGINAYLFAARYDAAQGEAASTVLVSTVVSVATITLLLLVLRG